MMNPPNKNRKKVHLSLFIFVIFLQITILFLWYYQSKAETNHAYSYLESNKPNLAFLYTNEATKHYFNAENEFIEYFHAYDVAALRKYESSLEQMTAYLDSLNSLVQKEKHFHPFISNKKKKEKEIIALRLELEELLQKNDFSNIETTENRTTSIHPYNYKNVLKSIKYDTIHIDDEVIKKGLIGRIADAFKGKTAIKKEHLHVIMTVNYGDEEKTGTIENQLENVFRTTSQYYNREYNSLKTTYSSLKKRDQELIKINRSILNHSQEILLFYTNYIQEFNKSKLILATNSIETKKNLIFVLMALMAVCTLLLLAYSLYAYLYEKDLSMAKTEAENSLKFRNRIIGMLSHEMRAPLNIISSITAKLKNSDESIQKQETINLLHFTSNSLQITVNQILNYFKSENSKLTLYNSKIQLKQEIKSILESLKSLAESKSIDFNYTLDENLSREVYIDTGKLHQLFYNIIGNAIKFTDKGGVTVICELKPLENKDQLLVKISDTGIGIPKEDFEKVFDKFYQSENSKSKISFGAGLGLNLCREITALYEGKIHVESELNQGTSVIFDLLLEKADSTQKSSKELLIEKFSSKEIKVAVVDDDKFIVAILKKLLTEIHFTPTVFSTSEEMKNYLTNNSTHLIISDIQIGQNSGIDLVETIKNLKNTNSKVPIIMITGDEYMSSISTKSLLINEIIIKPINKEELYTKLLKLLS